MIEKDIVVIYHKKCPDGFGAAYAAWKKFGDKAQYIEMGYRGDLPEGLEGKEVYILDFALEQPGAMDHLTKIAKRVVALDHHESSKELTEKAADHVFDMDRSGATIAWKYFHPDEPMPRLMMYLEDGDLYRNSLPETEEVFAYLVVQPDDFHVWDSIVHALDDDTERAALLAKATAYNEYFEQLCQISVEAAKKVRFEGHECYFATTSPSITLRSRVAHELYMKLPPFALIVRAHPDGYGVSIRGNGTVDVAKIAAKFGGGGHPGSAGFFIPYGSVLPWVEVED